MKIKSIIYILFSLPVFLSCSEVEESPEETSLDVSDDEVVLTPEMIKNGGVELGGFVEIQFSSSITVNGRVEVLPNNMASVSSNFSGNIVEINVHPGDKVLKGQKLFVIENSSFVEMQGEYLMTEVELINLKQEYERQKGLASENITAKKSFQAAEKDYLMAEAKLATLKSELNMMNISADKLTKDNLSSRIAIYAPIEGVLTSVHVQIGSHVSPENVAMQITGIEGKMLVFDVFDKDKGVLNGIDKIEYRTSEEKNYRQADLISVLPMVDGASNSIELLADPGVDNQLIAGAFVSGKVQSISQKGWALSEDAILKNGELYFVWLVDKRNDDGITYLRKQDVLTGAKKDGFVQIINFEEFPINAQIVIAGGFNL